MYPERRQSATQNIGKDSHVWQLYSETKIAKLSYHRAALITVAKEVVIVGVSS